MTGLDVIKGCRNPDNGWLPIIESSRRIVKDRNEFGDVNIGWNAGLIGENRPFYAECWANEGITMLTVYMSTIGIEDYTDEQVDKLLVDAGYYTHRENSSKATAMTFTDRNGNEFFSLNVAVGIEDEVYIDGATIYPFGILNEYNSVNHDETKETEKTDKAEGDEKISYRIVPDSFVGDINYRVVGECVPGEAKIVDTDLMDFSDLGESILPLRILFDFCKISVIASVNLKERAIVRDCYILEEDKSPEYDAEKLTDYFFTAIYDLFEEDGELKYPDTYKILDSRVFLKDEYITKRENFKNTCLVNSRSDEIDVHIYATYFCGCLDVWGHELGESLEKYVGKDEYEYCITVDTEHSEKLFEALGTEPGKEEEALIKLFEGANGAAPLYKVLKENNIDYGFKSY